jgi:hypothetical protein
MLEFLVQVKISVVILNCLHNIYTPKYIEQNDDTQYDSIYLCAFWSLFQHVALTNN